MIKKIFLIGMPGSGKTTLGKNLATRLGVKFVDLDREIEITSGKSINRIFEEDGEGHFRKLESRALKDIIEKASSFVVATGGGAACFFDNMEQMKRAGTIVYLDVPAEELFKRLKTQSAHRPLLKDRTESDLFDELREKLEGRRRYYEGADIVVKGDNISAEDLVSAIEKGTPR